MTDLPDILARATPEQLAAALIEAREGLRKIESTHIPDQPASSPGDGEAWARRHYGWLRGEATTTLSRIDAIMNPGAPEKETDL